MLERLIVPLVLVPFQLVEPDIGTRRSAEQVGTALAAPLAAQDSVPLRLALADAVARAARDAAPVTLAALRTDEAVARARQARSGLLPSLSAGASWLNRTFNRASLGFDFPTPPGGMTPPDLIGPFDNVDARLRVTQSLFDYATLARIRAARSHVTSAEADGGVAAEAAAHGAALAYLRVARARAVLAARRADSALAAELVALAVAQRDAGVGTDLDVTRARTQLVIAREGVVLAESQLARSRIELGRALGLGPEAPVEAVEPLTDSTAVAGLPAGRAVAVTRALAARPDLAAEAARAEAARRSAGAIAAERLPRLEVAADYGLNGRTAPDAIATRQIALQVTLPILDGFRREGRLDEQRAAARAAEVRRADLERAAAAEVDVALLELRAAAAQQAIAAERLRLADEELAQARERFEIGTAGNIEVVDAQVSLLRARDAVIDARFAAAAARVGLARATGMAREVK